MKKEIEVQISTLLGMSRVDAGFVTRVYLFKSGEISRYYWPEVTSRPGYWVVRGAIGVIFTDEVKPKLGITGDNSINSALYTANIRELDDLAYMKKDDYDDQLNSFIDKLKSLINMLPKTYAEAWELYERGDTGDWISKILRNPSNKPFTENLIKRAQKHQ